jgi:hypothetical protein
MPGGGLECAPAACSGGGGGVVRGATGVDGIVAALMEGVGRAA